MPKRKKKPASSGGWRRHRWRIAGWALVPAILLVPLIAMRFTDSVRWTAFDFIMAAVLLSGTAALFEIALRMSRHAAYRVGAALALATAFLLVWVNLAVGIIGSEDHAANLLYVAVLVLGFVGVLAARFEPRGMAFTLAGMAGAQALIAVGTLALGWWQAAILTLVFAGLWLLSAGLFRKAARDQAAAP